MLLRTLAAATAVLAGVHSVASQSTEDVLSSIMISRKCIQGIGNLNSYLGSVCPRQNCTETAVTNATTIMEAGCVDELNANNTAIVAIRDIVANFPRVKEGICLQQSPGGSFCANAVLTNVQNALGTNLTLANLATFNLSKLEELPPQRMCDNCLHAMTTKLLAIFESDPAESEAGRSMAGYCGSTFLDGEIPSTVQQWSENSTVPSAPAASAEPPSSGATKASLSFTGMALTSILGLSLLG
ncbi:hypothetical protein JCM3774_000671 [Rhodotorula dairenensis]